MSKATNGVFVTLGASNHATREREREDFYSTDSNTLQQLLDRFKLHNRVWECACGNGVLSETLKTNGYEVESTDLIDRGYGTTKDFFTCHDRINYDILTNPPYKKAQEFVEHALELVTDGNRVVMLLKIQFLESERRRKLFDKYPPKYVYVFSKRQTCYLDGDTSQKLSSAICYAWYIWEKGFTGEPTIRWI